MKIAIVSDSHDNLANLEKFLGYAEKEGVELVIHCGDVTNAETLEMLAKSFPGPIHFVYGNVANNPEDLAEVAEKLPNLHLYGHEGKIEVEGKVLGFCHKPEEAQGLSQKGNFDFIFYGHTHLPWVEKRGSTLLVNPGTLGGVFTEPTFTFLDIGSNKLELKRLQSL